MDLRDLAGTAIRMVITYVYLLVIIRISGKRVVGEATPLDLIVAFIVGDMPDNIIWGEVPVAQGLVAMGSAILLHLLIVYGSFRNPGFDRLVNSRPSTLVLHGRVVRETQQSERLNDAEVRSLLRQQELADPDDIDQAFLEPSGELSVRKRSEAKPATRGELRQLRGDAS